jgi:hypothetical protein
MNDDMVDLPRLGALPSAGRARLNRWAWWWQHRLGWPGALAVAALLACLALALAVRPSLERARADNLRQQVQRLAALVKSRPAESSPEADPRYAWRASLPGWGQRAQVVRRMLVASKASRVEFERADYTTEAKEPGIVHMQATLPLTASYEQVRQVMAAILNEVPNAALDALELERSRDDVNLLTGRLRVSFFFRGED